MNCLIYNFKTHSLNYTNRLIGDNYSLTIVFLELIFSCESNALLGIQSFLPLVNAIKCDIEILKTKDRIFRLDNMRKKHIVKGNVYDYFDVVGFNKNYSQDIIIKFDDKKGIIELDVDCKESEEDIIEISKNIICAIDKQSLIKRIYIKPDKFI